MVKLPRDLQHVRFVKSKGKLYAYFNTGKKNSRGKPIRARLPDLTDPSFWHTYAGHMKGRANNDTGYTIKKLVNDYQDSREYADKSRETHRTYSKYLHRIVRELGDFPIDELQRADVRLILKPMQETPGAHNLMLSVLGAIYRWARQHDKTEADPTKDILKMDIGTHEPWPDHILEAGLTSENNRIRLLVHILFFTGLRISDALKLRWSNVKGDFIHVIPTKTVRFHKELKIKIAQELADELAQTPRNPDRIHETIVRKSNGTPLGYALALRDLKEFTADLGHETVPHGLRKNAVNALLEAGVTVPEVSAITGQSFRIVEQYGKRMNRGVMSDSGVTKLDSRRKKQTR